MQTFRTRAQVVEDINEVLQQSSDVFVREIAKLVLGREIEYDSDAQGFCVYDGDGPRLVAPQPILRRLIASFKQPRRIQDEDGWFPITDVMLTDWCRQQAVLSKNPDECFTIRPGLTVKYDSICTCYKVGAI